MFKMSLTIDTLSPYIALQLGCFYPEREVEPASISEYVMLAMERTEHCFSKINIKYYNDGKDVHFNHLNTDQYAVFLYYLSNTVFRESGDPSLAAKIYGMNKALHGLDAFYEVELPDVFLLVHPLGTVLGRATYSDFFVAYQRVSVGANNDNIYPELGPYVAMFPGSTLNGHCIVEENCLIAADSTIMNMRIPSGMVAFGKHPNVMFKETKRSVAERFFHGPNIPET
jgi:serine O-acetyltransferase